jgi:2,3,4,5-tetrahydropyridine-2-carboxylate N-succinyltransferase
MKKKSKKMPEVKEKTLVKSLESGEIRAAEFCPSEKQWKANLMVKEGILSLFRDGSLIEMGPFCDKDSLPLRQVHVEDRIRLVPGGSSIRCGSYIAPGVIIMPPSYINIGAYIDEGTLVDSHVLVGSCAQVGKNVHLSAHVTLGGVLEPIGQRPVIIEDQAFIGAGVKIVEGICIGKGAVIAPGVILSKAVAVYDAVHECVLEKGEAIPPYAVVVPGSRPIAHSQWAMQHGLQTACPVIVKYRDCKTDLALSLEEALRT